MVESEKEENDNIEVRVSGDGRTATSYYRGEPLLTLGKSSEGELFYRLGEPDTDCSRKIAIRHVVPEVRQVYEPSSDDLRRANMDRYNLLSMLTFNYDPEFYGVVVQDADMIETLEKILLCRYRKVIRFDFPSDSGKEHADYLFKKMTDEMNGSIWKTLYGHILKWFNRDSKRELVYLVYTPGCNFFDLLNGASEHFKRI